MSSDVIALRQNWRLGAEMTKGGFGHIYTAEAEDGSPAVIKLIPKEPGASRELLFEPVSGLPNIIPILDTGEWKDNYVIVMPRADESLRQHLVNAGGKLPIDEVILILIDVATALERLERDVVHRDIKPENVLLYQGMWCIADFGISRYAAATTAADTRKFAFTAPYAAPEQWRFEHATPAADVYAFGVMAFEILEGKWPFGGPDFREQHIREDAPRLAGIPIPLASLIAECLYKAPPTRPTPANILARLRTSLKPPSPATAKLQAANQQIVAKQAQEGAKVSAQQSVAQQRAELVIVARKSFEQILEALIENITEAAPAASVTRRPNLVIRLGDGALAVDPVTLVPAITQEGRFGAPAFDVVAYAAIAARKPRDHYDYEGRSHSPWFCDAHEKGVYRWFEMAFMVMPLRRERFTLDPFALSPTDEDAAGAFWSGMANRQLAWEPLPFDQGDEEQFIERWLGWLADASKGRLNHPSSLPEHSGGRHRSIGS